MILALSAFNLGMCVIYFILMLSSMCMYVSWLRNNDVNHEVVGWITTIIAAISFVFSIMLVTINRVYSGFCLYALTLTSIIICHVVTKMESYDSNSKSFSKTAYGTSTVSVAYTAMAFGLVFHMGILLAYVIANGFGFSSDSDDSDDFDD